MKEIFVYATRYGEESSYLVGIKNTKKLSNEELLKFKCIFIDLKEKIISDKIASFNSSVKFGMWEDLQEKEEDVLNRIYQTFSKEEIEEKIIKPLMQNE